MTPFFFLRGSVIFLFFSHGFSLALYLFATCFFGLAPYLCSVRLFVFFSYFVPFCDSLFFCLPLYLFSRAEKVFHTYDYRYQDGYSRQRVAAMYLPLIHHMAAKVNLMISLCLNGIC